MTKSKSSTIAIVALSVLLAAALAATIVLAAFNASKQATTTITFANGITITVTGITPLSSATEETKNTANYWNYTATGTKNEGTATNVTTDAVFENIIVNNASTADDIYVIIQPIIKQGSNIVTADYYHADTDNDGPIVNTIPTGWVALNNGWYLLGTSTSAATSVAQSTPAAAFTGFTIKVDEGKTYTAVVNIYAANASDAEAGLADVTQWANGHAAA